MKKPIFLVVLISMYLALGGFICAQPGVNDPSFNVYDNGAYGDETQFDNDVYATEIQADGKILVGGFFESYNGDETDFLTRLNIDGSRDTNFVKTVGFGSAILAIKVLPNGKIIVGGGVTQFQSSSPSSLVCLNPNGTIDTSFMSGSGTNSSIRSISVDSNNKIIIVGSFSQYDGETANRIARLNSDGTLDSTFNSGSGFNSSFASTSYVQTDGKVIVGGSFSAYNGAPAGNFVRINTDGSIDTSFNLGSGFNNPVRAVKIQPDGKIIAVGNFTEYNGINANRIIRLNSDGSIDSTFNTGSGFTGQCWSLALRSNGKILIGGGIEYNGTPVGRLVQLNIDGTLDTTFNNISPYNNTVRTISLQSDGEIITGGTFSAYDGVTVNKIARLDIDGNLDLEFNKGSGFNNNVLVSIVQPDGRIIVGGNFLKFNGSKANRIARLNPDGSTDTTFNTGEGFNLSVIALALQSDGKIVVGGSLMQFDGNSTTRIARLNSDGSLDSTFSPGTIFNHWVRSLAIQPDGKIIAGGSFNNISLGVNKVSRLNQDGTVDPSFSIDMGIGGNISAIHIQSDGRIIVGGDFNEINNVTHSGIARLLTNGDIDPSFDVGSGVNGIVYSIAEQSNGKIIIVGDFTEFNGTNINNLARLNDDGTLDTDFNIGNGTNDIVYSASIQPNDKIILGGAFTEYNGETANRIVRLNENGNIDNLFYEGDATNEIVRSLAIQNDGKIIVAGDFVSFNEQHRNRITRLLNCSTIGTEQIVTCDSVSWINNVTYYSSTNSAYHYLTNAAGCDSIIMLDLTILNSTSGIDQITTCDSLTWIDGITYTASNNTAEYTLTNATGCDSIVTLDLTILNSTSGIDQITACDSLTWIDGITYTASNNTAEYTLTNAAGCDSIVTLDLTILNSTSGIDQIIACDSLTWIDGITYTASNNTAEYTLTNAAGCDSIVTLDLTILNSTTGTDQITVCDSLTWIDGITYTTSNNTAEYTLTNAAGCDSIVTLDLTITNSFEETDSIVTCASAYFWPVDGNTYTQSGIYFAQFTNQAGCDSTHVLDLTIDCSLYANVSVTNNNGPTCDGEAQANVYFGLAPYSYLYSNGETASIAEDLCSGVYDLTVTDSDMASYQTVFVVSDLTIDYNNDPTYQDYLDSLFSSAVNDCDFDYNQPADSFYVDQNSIVQLDTNLYEITWYVYQNQDTFIMTNVYYTTEDINGSLAFVLTMYCEDANRGVLESVTFTYKTKGELSTQNIIHRENLKLYPNPSGGVFTLESELLGNSYTIVDAQGRLIQTGDISSNTQLISLEDETVGVYYLKVGSEVLKMVKR